MIALSTTTAAVIALHAAQGSWLVYLQLTPPGLNTGPIKIEGIRGDQLASRLATIARDNAFEVRMIGMSPTLTPLEDANAIAADFEQAHLHDGWFEPTDYILTHIEHTAQDALQELLDRTHPAGLGDQPVDIERMAEILECSVITVRRLVKSGQIPYLKFGRIYRFVPADVIASLDGT